MFGQHKTKPLIAVVNQDTLFLELMEGFLEDEGYEAFIEKHANPDESFVSVKNRKPDLVVLDVLLTNPEAGFTIINLMRLDPQTAYIPIIVCSTSSALMRENEQRLREKRCDILLKPFELEELLAMVSKYVNHT